MSWDSYRDSLVGTGVVKKAAVCGADDKDVWTVWTRSPDFNVTQAELEAVIGAFKDPSPLLTEGIYVGGQKFTILQSDESQIQAKQGTSGIAIAKSNKCVIIGEYDSPTRHENCREQVERVRDYLLQNNY